MLFWRKDVPVLILLADLITIQQALHNSAEHRPCSNDASLICATGTELETVTTDESTTSGWSNLAKQDPVTSTDGLTSAPSGHPGDSSNCSNYESDVEKFKDVYDRFSIPASATELFLCVCSVVTNALSIMVHKSKRIVLPTLLIALSSSDIVQGLGSCVIQIRFFFNARNELRSDSVTKVKDIMMYSVGRSVFLSLQRISHIINAFMCLDRFIHLSRPVLKNTCIQKHSKFVLVLVMLFVLTSGACESYAIYNERLLLLASGAANPECIRPETDNSSSAIMVTSAGSALENVTANPHAVTKKPVGINSNRTIDHVTSGLTETTPLLVEDATTWSQGIQMTSSHELGHADSIFQNTRTSLVNNIITYILLMVMVILTTITIVFLKRHAQKRQQLGVGGSGQRQTRILVTITTVYVLFSLPSISVSLIRDLKIWPEFEIGGKLRYLFMILVKMCSMSEQLKNISDFIVFIVMSRTFRTTLLSTTFLKRQQP